MPDPDTSTPPEPPPDLPTHLRAVAHETGWVRGLALVGLILLGLVLVLTFVAPSALWFLLYPLLIAASLAALTTAAAFLLRRM